MLVMSLFLFPFFLDGQSINKNLMATAGDVYIADDYSLEWTLGEVFINDHSQSNLAVQEGFLATSEESFATALLADMSLSLSSNQADSAYFPGEVLDLSLDISNIGEISAFNSVGGIYISQDQIIDASDHEIELFDIAEIPIQNSITVMRNLILPPDLTAGKYFVIAQADIFDDIIELDKTNNTAYITILVRNIADAPDLAIASYSLTPEFIIDESTSLILSINNSGNFGSDPSELGFYLSIDNIIDSADYYVDMAAIQSLGPSESNEVIKELVIIDSSLIGDQYLFLYVDHNNSIVESVEENNLTSIPIKIKAKDQTTATVEQNSAQENFTIIPNPASTRIRIHGVDISDNYNFMIYSNLGQLLVKGDMTSDEINVSSLKDGLYQLLIVKNANIVSINTFVILEN